MTEQRRAAAVHSDSPETAGRPDLATIVDSHQESTVGELLAAGGLCGFTPAELLERKTA